MSHKPIIKDIKSGNLSPIYLLMGEEPHFIDLISDCIEAEVVPEDMKGFNEHVFYGLDTDVQNLIGVAKSFPMMGDRQLVLVKEAQSLKNIQALAVYCQQPTPTTVFVLCHKYKKLDKRKELYKVIAKNGVVFTSDPIRDYNLPSWISEQAKSLKVGLNEKQCGLLAEYLGTELTHIISELKKLKVAADGNEITDDLIQDQIGVSKSYNMFELQLAVLARDFKTTMKITDYFVKNPKSVNIIPAISGLYKVYTRLIKLFYAKDKSKNNTTTGISYYMHPKYMAALQKYSLKKIVYNVSVLKTYDLKVKGVGNSGADNDGLFLEMMQKLML